MRPATEKSPKHVPFLPDLVCEEFVRLGIDRDKNAAWQERNDKLATAAVLVGGTGLLMTLLHHNALEIALHLPAGMGDKGILMATIVGVTQIVFNRLSLERDRERAHPHTPERSDEDMYDIFREWKNRLPGWEPKYPETAAKREKYHEMMHDIFVQKLLRPNRDDEPPAPAETNSLTF